MRAAQTSAECRVEWRTQQAHTHTLTHCERRRKKREAGAAAAAAATAQSEKALLLLPPAAAADRFVSFLNLVSSLSLSFFSLLSSLLLEKE